MSENESENIVEEITEETDALPDNAVDHEPPPWVESLIQKIEAIPDAVAAALPNPVSSEAVSEVVEEDESPAKPPWTHRGF